MSWLRSGPATVSELANQFDMRMSHASLACRQLRAADLIVRDESGGLRNAPISLSQKGLERLRENAVSKLRKYADHFSSKSSACVLQVDDSNVLIGYADLPPGPMVFIRDGLEIPAEKSTGNRGGVWVLIDVESIAWFTTSDFSSTSPPASASGTTLQDFSDAPDKVGLVRGSIFESVGGSQLIEGKVFATEPTLSTDPPSRLHFGPVPMGTVVGTKHSFYPPPGLVARLPSAVDRSLVLDALSVNALLISDKNTARHRHLPFLVLKPWLEARHPRMSDERREATWLELVAQLKAGERSLSVGLRRDLLIDFGEVHWSEEGWEVDDLDTYGMSPRGMTVVLTSVLSEVRHPFCIDWPFERVDEALYEQALVHPLCRLWVWRRGSAPTNRSQDLLLLPTSSVSVVNVHSGRKEPLPILLGGDAAATIQHIATDTLPRRAKDLLEHERLNNLVADGHALPGGEPGARLRKALDAFPVGDEALANAYEGTDALAAWIASPPDQRPGRWVRLHERLPDEWVNLLPVDDVPASHLVYAIKNGDVGWRTQALQRLRVELDTKPELLLSLLDGTSNEALGPWYAVCILGIVDPEAKENSDLLQQAFNAWSANPVCAAEVLKNLFGRPNAASQGPSPLLERSIRLGMKQPSESMLAVWATGMKVLAEGRPWLPEIQRRIMRTLPFAWWAIFAQEWLPVQLASVSGRTWLRENDLPWLAQLFHTEGWLGGLPGNPLAHAECKLTSEQLIGVKMLGEGVGVAALDDLYESLYAFEQGLPPPPCKTHPLAGWLVRPPMTWPAMDESVLLQGDKATGRLLFAKAYHHNVAVKPPLS